MQKVKLKIGDLNIYDEYTEVYSKYSHSLIPENLEEATDNQFNITAKRYDVFNDGFTLIIW